MKRWICMLLSLLMLISLVPAALADDYYFTDRDGTEIMVPDGGFATRVVEFTPGDPWTDFAEQQKVENVLGVPDYTGDEETALGDLTLGAGGVLVLEFNISIFDGDGLDIYVFEVGEQVEDTKIEVSRDLITWYDVGVAKGRTAGVDIKDKVPEGSRFRYVRLTDLRSHTTSDWPGADIDAVSGLNIKSVTDVWADSEVDRAVELNLVPDMLKNSDMTQHITRKEFAAVAVKVYESLTGTAAVPTDYNPFTDTDEVEVLKAYNLGIIQGTSETTFTPDQNLTREQAATMLTRVFKRVRVPGWTLQQDALFPLEFEQTEPFVDDNLISDYARESVYFMAANGIINGFGGGFFVPRNTTTEQEAIGYANATREQAMAIAVRMVDNLQ